jgi:hypothetical protein
MAAALPARAHVIAGGFPPGQAAGHDHDYARLRLLGFLAEQDIPASTSNDYVDIERWLPISRLLITYVAGPYPAPDQDRAIRSWIAAGGKWLALHGTTGGRAVRVEGVDRRRAMARLEHHETLGGFFLNHPPMRKFEVRVHSSSDRLTEGMPETFVTIDEPYMVEMSDPSSRVLLTAELGPDNSPRGFGFQYETDTALLPDGKTRVMGYTRKMGDGGVTYIALGHAHTPATNVQPFVDPSVDPEGKTPPVLRTSWETDAYATLIRNSVEWGMGG